MAVSIPLNRLNDVPVERNTVDHEPIVKPNDPVVNQPVEPNVETPLRRS